MKINAMTGVGYRDAVDMLLSALMKEHGITRREAMFLLRETLVRNCVVDEIMATAAALIGKDGE